MHMIYSSGSQPVGPDPHKESPRLHRGLQGLFYFKGGVRKLKKIYLVDQYLNI